jgi:hypothetical protein
VPCSFFGEQEGDFELTIRSIAAVKKGSESAPYRDDPEIRSSLEGVDEKWGRPVPARQGWFDWLIGGCVKL